MDAARQPLLRQGAPDPWARYSEGKDTAGGGGSAQSGDRVADPQHTRIAASRPGYSVDGAGGRVSGLIKGGGSNLADQSRDERPISGAARRLERTHRSGRQSLQFHR